MKPIFIFALAFFSLSPALAKVSDVPSYHWASSAVKEIVDDYEFMKGDGNGRFAGDRSLSRYELAVTLSRLISFYNNEFEADRQDLASLVGIMEQFQKEMRTLDQRIIELESSNSEYRKIIENYNGQIQVLEDRVHELDDKGFLIDSLIVGSGNDVKHLFQALTPDKKKKDIQEQELELEVIELEELE